MIRYLLKVLGLKIRGNFGLGALAEHFGAAVSALFPDRRFRVKGLGFKV